MFLHTNCYHCKKKIPISSSARARTELEDELGAEFTVKCKNCGTKDKRHVNRVNASPNLMPVAIAVLIGVVVTLALWSILGAIGTVSMAIPLLAWYQQSSVAHKFNSNRIPRNV